MLLVSLVLALVPVEPTLCTDEGEAKKLPNVELEAKRAHALLVDLQENLASEKGEKREWPYEGVYREKGQIPVGYRVGGTAISAWALIESPHHAKSKASQAAVARAVEFLFETLENPAMSAGFSGGYDVRGWGHAYALQLFLRLRAQKLVPKGQEKKLDLWVTKLVETLHATEIVESGGWNYSRPGGGAKRAPASPFMTAPTLIALFEAQRQGEKVDAGLVTRALDALEGCRTEAGAIPYNTGAKKDEWPGAIGRSPITECVLVLSGRGSVDNVRRSLDNFLEHWEWLEKRRKGTGTHVPPYGVAPYYFFYAHGYAALSIEFLPEAERESYRERFLARLFQVQEASGGWNDRIFPRSENYGTAMGLLAMLAPKLPRPTGWEAPAPTTQGEAK
jgi:hypothetical protein